MVKNPPATAGNLRDAGSIPGSGRSSRRGGHGRRPRPVWTSLQHTSSCGILEIETWEEIQSYLQNRHNVPSLSISL